MLVDPTLACGWRDDDRNEIAHDRNFGACAQPSIGFSLPNRPKKTELLRGDNPSEQFYTDTACRKVQVVGITDNGHVPGVGG